MMNLEIEDDGCRNEYQRAFARSQMQRERHDARDLAKRLAADGLFVVLEAVDVHCPITDGLLGQDYYIRAAFGDRKAAEAMCNAMQGHCDNVGIVDSATYQPPVSVAPASPDEDIPF
jgi:hypothetical protein